ncbi:rhodanese-like domain-containing protein [Psychromonas sp. SP041]|uniref:rhodanese-like domain-containing protein n=1 Tax=Psychromonas sp. SP041 TaxID=1365007 RepID=UPI00040E2391|nr:rhodanese-like domain-containing protein [Psychromonas sp. SP041]
MVNKSIKYTLIFTLGMLFNTSLFAEPIWIDVRSYIENKVDNIEGDKRISHSDIVDEISELFPDKNTDIRLYCRSGIRAENALSALHKAGYNNVINVGSIEHARELRFNNEPVK